MMTGEEIMDRLVAKLPVLRMVEIATEEYGYVKVLNTDDPGAWNVEFLVDGEYKGFTTYNPDYYMVGDLYDEGTDEADARIGAITERLVGEISAWMEEYRAWEEASSEPDYWRYNYD